MNTYDNVKTKPAYGFDIVEGSDTHSFIGGLPYWNEEFEWPHDSEGEPLMFFAQVNLQEVDKRVKNFLKLPDEGYIQFFHGSDDLMGMDLETKDHSENVSKILYFKHAEDNHNLISPFKNKIDTYEDFSPLENIEERVFIKGKYFDMKPYPNSVDSPDYGQGIDDYMDFYENSEEEYYALWLGGYPHFTQADFREYVDKKDRDKYVLLAGSESKNDVMWGDMGAAGFWITEEMIKNRSFDDNFIYWDCG